MNFTKPVIAAVALAAALSLTACGSDDNGAATTTTASAAAAAPTEDQVAMPTVEDLNVKLQMALDPSVSAEEKAAFVQGLESDPALLQQLSESVAQAKADGVVSNIQVVGPLTPVTAEQMSVPFTMDIDGQPQQGAVDVVIDQGEWKLSKVSICNLASLLDITSAECAA